MRRLGIPLAAAALAGCVSLSPQPSAYLTSSVQPLQECAQWYEDLDARVDASGVRDAQDTRISGFPYLRVSRLLASFRAEASADDARLRALVDRMHQLDLNARRAEIGNIPADAAPAAARNAVIERAETCATLMREADLADPPARAALIERAQVPDDYSTTSRILGLYALTRIPFGWGIREYQAQVRSAFERDPALPPDVRVLRYSPPAADTTGEAVASIIARASSNPLGIPQVSGRDLEQLYAAYAPELEIEVAGDYDRFGALYWKEGATVPAVDTSTPRVYRKLSWTRYHGRTLLQLVYTIWFSERPPASDGDILAGLLDGVTWRVTLAPDGEPLVYDTVHPCGCYHMFFPTPRASVVPPSDDGVEFMFSPQSLPRIDPGRHTRLRIATGTHYVERVSVVSPAEQSTVYRFAEYDELRSLPRPEGGRASVFGTQGLIAGTERPERFLFWPMGIASAGAMRQWGRHATAFVGRRHFDDPDLLEKRFVLNVP